MVKQFNFLTMVFFFFVLQSLAQHRPIDSKETTSLTEGVFMTKEQFLKQQPAYSPDDLYHAQGISHFTIKAWSNKDSLYIIKDKRKQTIQRDSVWGFFDDEILFIQRNGFFHKVTLFGSISLFNEIYPLLKAPFTPVTTDATKEIIPGMIDLHTGKFYPYDPKSVMELLQSDEVLLNNYKALNKKQRKKMMYSYVERFNDRHPWTLL